MFNKNTTLVVANFLFILCSSLLTAQIDSSYHEEILAYRQAQNQEFADPKTSPLPEENLESFDSLTFFPVNPKYRVNARLEPTIEAEVFEMPTTTGRKALYREYGKAFFTIDTGQYLLTIYQNLELEKIGAYKDYLFLPFTDETNGSQTYGGGRYLDLRIPDGDTIVIDFNKVYNPYCAYNPRYSCPVPPPENDLPIAIEAGVLKPVK